MEYHAHETSEMYDIIDSGMIARPQPLLMIITTVGFNLNNPCYRVEYKIVSNILDPNNPFEMDYYFVMINELDKNDDIKDEKVWPKANPIVCSYPEGMKSIRERLKLALEDSTKMRDFLTKTCNIWIQLKDGGYMDLSKWNKCGVNKESFDFSILEGKETIVGVDLSTKLDLTSIGFEFKIDNKYYIFGHSFIPEDKYWEKVNTDGVPYDMWSKEGWLTTTPGAVIDYSYITAKIQKFEKEYNCKVKEICYDPYNASHWAAEMEKLGYTMVQTRQGIITLGEPTKNFREEVYNHNVVHLNDPVIAFAMGDAVVKDDHNDNIMLDKKKSIERIDPAACIMNSHTRAMYTLISEDIFIALYRKGVR